MTRKHIGELKICGIKEDRSIMKKINRNFKLITLLSLCLFFAGSVFAENELSYQKITFKEDGDRYSVTIEYPQVKTSQNTPQNIRTLNKAILGFAQSSLMDRLPEVRGEDTLDYDGEFEDFWKNLYSVEFNIDSFSEKIVSIKFERYWHYIGAVHGYSSVRTFNYDPETAQVIQLKGIFAEGTDYLNQISAYAIKDLFDQYEKAGYVRLEGAVKEGAAPKNENFDNFGLGKDSLIIYFDDYEVGSYSVGRRSVSIPYSELTGIAPHFMEQIRAK